MILIFKVYKHYPQKKQLDLVNISERINELQKIFTETPSNLKMKHFGIDSRTSISRTA